MTDGEERKSGGRLIADALLAQGVDRVFCVPGESYLPLLDALYDRRDRIQVVTCRHEGGAVFMAEAHAKLTGRPGVCLVTRGPGACNASIGVHTAYQDSTPLILLVGQVHRRFLGREAFQEVDFRRMFAPLAKWAAQAEQADQIPGLMARAFATVSGGRPGPVVAALPVDVLREESDEPVPPAIQGHAPHPDPGGLERLHHILGDAERPMMVLGGGGWSDRARVNITAFAEANGLPVCSSFRRIDIIDNAHPCYVGELGYDPAPALIERVRQADLLLVVGSRLGEVASQGYSLVRPFGEGQALVHVHPDAEEFGRAFHPTLALQAGMPEFAEAARALNPVGSKAWGAWAAEARRAYEAERLLPPVDGDLDLGLCMEWLDGHLGADAVVTVDAGNFTHWPQRFLRFGGGRRLLGAVNGAMGYGVPAAVAAKLAAPDRPVVGFVGDGGWGMSGAELATAMQYGAAPILLLVNNGMYGTIRTHQEKTYPGRVIGTGLENPDFTEIARAHGAFAERITATADFAPAFRAAEASGTAAVLELRADPEQITTRTTISALRASAENP